MGSYSISKAVERFLKRMIVPNADLRCTTTELLLDGYWENPSSPMINVKAGHSKCPLRDEDPGLKLCDYSEKSASAGHPATRSHVRSPTLLAALRDVSKEKAKNKDKDTSMTRLLDISLPWSGSRSASRSSASASRPVSRSESRMASRSVSRAGTATPTSAMRSRVPSCDSDEFADFAKVDAPAVESIDFVRFLVPLEGKYQVRGASCQLCRDLPW